MVIGNSLIGARVFLFCDCHVNNYMFAKYIGPYYALYPQYSNMLICQPVYFYLDVINQFDQNRKKSIHDLLPPGKRGTFPSTVPHSCQFMRVVMGPLRGCMPTKLSRDSPVIVSRYTAVSSSHNRRMIVLI